jgi:hypothetical protein
MNLQEFWILWLNGSMNAHVSYNGMIKDRWLKHYPDFYLSEQDLLLKLQTCGPSYRPKRTARRMKSYPEIQTAIEKKEIRDLVKYGLDCCKGFQGTEAEEEP